MTDPDHRGEMHLAAALWLAAAVIYLASEAISAAAFSPAYSYAHNFISDLGVPVCGTVFDGRTICSPLHLIMNAGFLLQAPCFAGAAMVIVRVLTTPTRFVLLACAVLDGVGLILLGIFPESSPTHADHHVLGALLSIVFGNATAMASAFAFKGLRLPRIHQTASAVLPLVAAGAFTMLLMGRGSGVPHAVPSGVWERLSVYTIIAWELLTAGCLFAAARRGHYTGRSLQSR